MKRIGILLLCLFLLLPTFSASAEIVQEKGAVITLHVNSPWYIYGDAWLTASQPTEQDAYGNLFISSRDFTKIFGIRVQFNPDDNSIFVEHGGHEIWQGLNTPVMFVDKKPYPNPAAYLSENGAIMIPAEPYASVFGYIGSFSTSPNYAPGQLRLVQPTKIYSISSIDSIEVNKAMQMVIVYGRDGAGNKKPIRHFLCSTGAPTSLTPNGTYKAKPLTYSTKGNPWYYFEKSNCWILYCTQVIGDICFHSVPFNRYGATTLSQTGYNAMGSPASHGCIRLLVEDAKYIWENCRNVPITITEGYYDDSLNTIKQNLQAARPSYQDYVAELVKTY